jgi:hypothetical protein
MYNQYCRSLFLAAALLVVGLGAGPARADLKISMHITMDNPRIQQMMQAQGSNLPPQVKAMMDKMLNSDMTIYTSGKKSRVDKFPISTVTDAAGGKTIMINNQSHTYYISTFDSTKPQHMSVGSGPGQMGGDVSDINVTDTGNTKTILNHLCHEYIMTMKITSKDGDVMNMKNDTWAAKDFTGIDPAAYGAFSSTAAGMDKIGGMPLEMTMTFTGGKAEGTSMNFEVTAISNDALPDSTFAIPDGYTQSTSPMMMSPMGAGGMGGMGGGMGGMGAGGMGGQP